VERQLEIVNPFNNAKSTVTLQYTATLLLSGQQSLYFQKPAYLQDYPDGVITTGSSTEGGATQHLPTSSRQDFDYHHFDSLIWRQRRNIAGEVAFNFYYFFEPGFQTWEYLPETKEEGGLRLQKAIWKNAKGILQYEVWFCPDIPAKAGPSGIVGLPGLVVEAFMAPLNKTMKLESYQLGCTIADDTLWPVEFYEPFQFKGQIRKFRKQ
jgi:GLPGLI family protein